MLNPFFHPFNGGTEKYLLETGKRLVERGMQISVLSASLPKTKRIEMVEGIKSYHTPSFVLYKLLPPLPPPFPISPFLAVDILTFARKEKPDFFHIHNRFAYQLGTLEALKISRVPLLLTLHNALPQNISPSTDALGRTYDEVFGRRWMEEAEKIIANSQYTMESTVPTNLRDKCTVIYNGVDVQRFKPLKKSEKEKVREELKLPASEPLIIYVGRFVKQKGINYLFEAFKRISKEKGINLLMIGKGPEFEFFKAASRRMKVKMIYNAPEEKLPLYFACADVCVVPSLWEPFGLVAVEAMACGLPVIASNVGGLREIIEKDCGVLVKPADSNALADEIVEMLRNEDKRKKMGMNGRKRAEKYFSWETVTKKLYNFYQKL